MNTFEIKSDNLPKKKTNMNVKTSSSYDEGFHKTEDKNLYNDDVDKNILLFEFFTPSGVCIQIKNGDITLEKCEALVNPADTYLINYGRVSKALSSAVGPHQFESECQKIINGQKKQPLNISEVVSTPAGRIPPPVKYILHAIGPKKVFNHQEISNGRSNLRDSDDESLIFNHLSEMLKMTFFNCLDYAANVVEVESVAMPAISSGVTGVDMELIAKMTFSAIKQFDERCRNNNSKNDSNGKDFSAAKKYPEDLKNREDILGASKYPEDYQNKKDILGSSKYPDDFQNGKDILSASKYPHYFKNGKDNLGASKYPEDYQNKKDVIGTSKYPQDFLGVDKYPPEDIKNGKDVLGARKYPPDFQNGKDIVRAGKYSEDFRNNLSESYAFNSNGTSCCCLKRIVLIDIDEQISNVMLSEALDFETEWRSEEGSKKYRDNRKANIINVYGSSDKKINKSDIKQMEESHNIPSPCSGSLNNSIDFPTSDEEEKDEYSFDFNYAENKKLIKNEKKNYSPTKTINSRFGTGKKYHLTEQLDDSNENKKVVEYGEEKNRRSKSVNHNILGGLTNFSRDYDLIKQQPLNKELYGEETNRKSKSIIHIGGGLTYFSGDYDLIKQQPLNKEPLIKELYGEETNRKSKSVNHTAEGLTNFSRYYDFLMEQQQLNAKKKELNGLSPLKIANKKGRDILEKKKKTDKEDTDSRSSSREEEGEEEENIEQIRKKLVPKYKEDTDSSQGEGEGENIEQICAICLYQVQKPEKLKCGHLFCVDCLEELKRLGSAQKCPCCNMWFNENQIGNQPDGTMSSRVNSRADSLPGYPGCKVIEITYNFPSGVQNFNHPNPNQPYQGTKRITFLPDNPEGQQVLKIFRKAFDRKLLFTIGKSVTTGRDNSIVWNDVHQKTSYDGVYGYPDPGYFDRVKKELLAIGISDDDDDDHEGYITGIGKYLGSLFYGFK